MRFPRESRPTEIWCVEFYDDFDACLRVVARTLQCSVSEVEFGWVKAVLHAEQLDTQRDPDEDEVSSDADVVSVLDDFFK
jgi:hypothetical protein